MPEIIQAIFATQVQNSLNDVAQPADKIAYGAPPPCVLAFFRLGIQYFNRPY
jgi:hypothetical protein